MTPVRPVVRITDHTDATRPSGPVRWLVALFTTAFMLAATLGIVTFAQSTRFGAGDGPTFLPEGAVAYAELRLDLPGDQREQLIAFLGSFPGFADPAAFDTKLDETLDQMLGGDASPISWTEDIKPWFGGQVMLGVPALPDLSVSMDSAEATALAVAALGVTDRAALDAAVAKLLGPMEDDVTTEVHGDTTIFVVEDSGTLTALAPTDDLLLFGNDLEPVRAALDVLDGSSPSLADDAEYQAAMAVLPADRLGAFWIDSEQIGDGLAPLLLAQLELQPQLGAMLPEIEALLELLPPAVTGHIRVDADHLTARIDALLADGASPSSVRATDLASKMPADTLVYLETRDLGAGIRALVAQLKPALAADGDGAGLQQIEALLGSGLEDYLDWVEDVAVGASLGIAGPSVGIAATVLDEETANERITSLLTLIRLITATADPSPLEISTQVVEGVTVTTVTVVDGAGMGDLPVQPQVSIALADGHLYLGLGDFAAQALTREPSDSLASAESFRTALGAVGEENAGMVFVDVAAGLGLAEQFMGSDDRERFEAQIKPYAEALDFIVAGLGQDEVTTSASLMLFVK